jgi:hypothetical protein
MMIMRKQFKRRFLDLLPVTMVPFEDFDETAILYRYRKVLPYSF